MFRTLAFDIEEQEMSNSYGFHWSVGVTSIYETFLFIVIVEVVLLMDFTGQALHTPL